MSRIDICHPHSLSMDQARAAIDAVAKKLSDRFDMRCHWEGDALQFSRSGVDGAIALAASELKVHAKLGFLAAMFKEPIEAEIRRVLQEKFQ